MLEYQAYGTSGEEVKVKATGTGITTSRSGNVITFSIPEGVVLMSAILRIPGAQLVSGALQIDFNKGYTGWADRWLPNVHAWREDTGSQLTITITQVGTAPNFDFDKVQINNLNASATNTVKIAW